MDVVRIALMDESGMTNLPFGELIGHRSHGGTSLRIGLLPPPQLTGDLERTPLGRWAFSLAVALVQGRQWNVDLATYGEVDGRPAAPDRVVFRQLVPHMATRDPLKLLSWNLPDFVDPVDVVIVMEPFTRPGEVTVLVAKALRKPVVVFDTGGRKSTIGGSLGLLELVDEIVCSSDFTRSLLSPDTRPVVVRGGVDIRFFTPPKARVRRDHMLVVAHESELAGLRALVETIPADQRLIVYDQHQRVKGQEERSISAAAVGKDVRFERGWDKIKLRDLYRSAYATVLPITPEDDIYKLDLYELVALESMACGTPAVVTDVGALGEIVKNGETGYLGRNLNEVVSRGMKLRDDAVLVGEIGDRAHSSVRRRFGMDVVASDLATLCARLVEPKTPVQT